MFFDLTSEQKDLQARARDLATDVIASRAAEVDRTEQYPWENVKALTDAGFMGMTVPKDYGGPGRSYLDTVLVIEAMAAACGVTGRIVVEGEGGVISAIMAYGSEAQKKLGPSMCSTVTSWPRYRAGRWQRGNADDHAGRQAWRYLCAER